MPNVVPQVHGSRQQSESKHNPAERSAREQHQADTGEATRHHNAQSTTIWRRLHMGRAVIGGLHQA